MGSLSDLNDECMQLIIDKLSCRGIATLRGSCAYYYEYMEANEWWEYFAERYCELYPFTTVYKLWVKYPKTALNELCHEYGHTYDIQWNKRSLAAFERALYVRDEEGVRIRRRRWRRKGIKADLIPRPPEDLSELIALCVLREFMEKTNKEIDRLNRATNKYYHARVGNKIMWRLWWDHGGNESLNTLWAINPMTGKPIRKDAPLYTRLQQNGYFD